MRIWGHPKGIHVDQLIKVPWLVHEAGTRRETTAEEPHKTEVFVSEDIVTDRLESLGYV
ncbi:hypothetical protein HAPAU_36920 [Halalkalicoccus paucihalophilus]|uniref:Uncharacterized protein n=1 Tax=Halalkalicoccus paucihalophilus TaxID=1008153 RepID=A0A151A964_9EURY|nr:hypothetical protein HAPAU_36920 [Halalkalicoccus paucihalophilus]